MRIRKEQIEAFSESLKEAYVVRMAAHLRDDFPEQLESQGLQEDDLEPLVRQGMADAEKYGVVYESDVQLYLECLVLLGPKFDRDRKYPWARQTLRRKDLDGAAKMDEIEQYLVFELEEPS